MTITVVNASSAILGSSVASVTSSPTFTSTTGNLLIVGTSCDGNANASTPITDTGSTNSFSNSKGPDVGTDPFWCNLAFAQNITGQAGEASTFTTTGAGFPGVALIEVSGCDTTSPNDVAAAWTSVGGGSVNTLNSSLITPASGDHLLFVTAVADTGSANMSVTNNGTGAATWTVIKNDSSSGEPLLVAYAVVTANGTNTYGVTFKQNNIGSVSGMEVGLAAFKAASGGGGATHTLSGSTTQTQTLSLAKQIGATRALTESQAVAMVRAPRLIRSIAQTQVLALVKQIQLTRALTEAQSATVVAQKVFLRTVSLTQTQAVALLKQIGLIRSDTQTQALALSKQSRLVRALSQAQSLVLAQQARLTRALVQAQSLSVVAQKVFLRTVSATQAQVVSLTTLGHHTYPLTVSASSHQSASVTYTVISFIAGAPPIPVAVRSVPPLSGSSTQNYLDWPVLIITPGGTVVGGTFGSGTFGAGTFGASGSSMVVGPPPPGTAVSV